MRHKRFTGFSPPSSLKTASPWWKTEWRTCLWLNMVLHCCKYHMKHMCFVNCLIYIYTKEWIFIVKTSFHIAWERGEKMLLSLFFFRCMIHTGRDSRMTQEVGSSCSTPWLFFQTFWFFSYLLLITAIIYLVGKNNIEIHWLTQSQIRERAQ